MPIKQSIVRVANIADIIADPSRGVVSLIGDHDGLSLITGDVNPSSLMMGLVAVETEHGTVYLDPDAQVTISEETPYDDEHEWGVEWSIDGYGRSPEHAAARIWRDTFGRSAATDEDACVFMVTDPDTGVVTRVDLSDFDFDSLAD